MLRVKLKFATLAFAIAAALAANSAGASAGADRKGHTAGAPCTAVPTGRARPTLQQVDIWASAAPYRFPFNGYTPKGRAPVIWRKIKNSNVRRGLYPAPNLPSCRLGRRGGEDRMTRKASQFTSSLMPIEGLRNYVMKDSFDRPVAEITWVDQSPNPRRPQQYGWYIDGKWAGHGATRAFEIQGEGCKLRVDPATRSWVRDRGYVMIAFNPALGSPDRRYRPRKTAQLRIRAFVDKRALPPWAMLFIQGGDFGCGEPVGEAPVVGPQPLADPNFQSGYGPQRQYMTDQYFGEAAMQPNLLEGERKEHNNMPLDAYNARPQFAHAMYANVNTTGVAGGGMVRAIVRAGADSFTLHDELTYCDPNYTLKHMLLRRNGQRVSKWQYFEFATFSERNNPSVRWVYGQITPGAATLTPEGLDAAANPANQALYAWVPLRCDR